MRFGYGDRKVYEGEADVERWDRKWLRVRPEGWTHGIWIGVGEIIETKGA